MPVLLPAVEVRQELHSVALTPTVSIFLFPPLPIYIATFLRDPSLNPPMPEGPALCLSTLGHSGGAQAEPPPTWHCRHSRQRSTACHCTPWHHGQT